MRDPLHTTKAPSRNINAIAERITNKAWDEVSTAISAKKMKASAKQYDGSTIDGKDHYKQSPVRSKKSAQPKNGG